MPIPSNRVAIVPLSFLIPVGRLATEVLPAITGPGLDLITTVATHRLDLQLAGTRAFRNRPPMLGNCSRRLGCRQ